jgi:hypothetical protein
MGRIYGASAGLSLFFFKIVPLSQFKKAPELGIGDQGAEFAVL